MRGLKRYTRETAEAFQNGLCMGYTLASGRLFCDWAHFQQYAEELLERPILTHEFAADATWAALRDEFEDWATDRWRKP